MKTTNKIEPTIKESKPLSIKEKALKEIEDAIKAIKQGIFLF